MEYLILLRHGQTSINTAEKLHAKNDEDILNEKGIEQTKEVAKKLKEFSPTKIYSSGEKRAILSAEIIVKELNIPLEIKKDIAERDWGDFAGGTWDKVKKILDPMTLEERYLYVPPNGESWQQFETRLIETVKNVLLENKNKTIVVVTHAGVVRALMPYLLGIPKEETFKYNPENASLTIFSHTNGKFTPILINDTKHLI